MVSDAFVVFCTACSASVAILFSAVAKCGLEMEFCPL